MAAAAVLGGANPRPNILFVLIDDLRFDDLGATGHPFARTPNIDRIAREGAIFSNAFVTTPLCSPSRASFLTGQYARRHGIVDNTARVEQSHRLMTFPRRLHEGGYETGYIGKWHMGNDDSPRPGFDHWVSFRGQGEYLDPELNDNGRRTRTRGYMTDLLSDRAVEFIGRKREKPFFLYLAHKAVHPDLDQRDDGSVSGEGIFRPAERHKSLYAAEPIRRRPNAGDRAAGKPALLRKIADLPPLGPATATDDETIRNRLRMLASVDEGMGRIFEALERTGRLDDTCIVFAGDNGYFYGEHGLSHERRLAYEESARMPLLIRYPRRVRAGARIREFALNIDVAPTVIEMAGAPPLAGMDGRSLAPLLAGRGDGWRSSFLIEHFSDNVFPRMVGMGYQAVRTGRWKYIHYTELKAMDELYDLRSDPYEMNNLIGSSGARRTLDQLRRELTRLLS